METKSVSSLSDHLGYWLRLVSNQVSGTFAVRLAARQVSVAEWVVLRELYEGAQPPSHLAARMGMTRGAITKLADRLAARKLLRRDADASDGRAQALVLTAAGKALVPRLAALADANDAEFFSSLSGPDRAHLMRLLCAVAARHGIDTTIPTE